jgi:hypothetical protein
MLLLAQSYQQTGELQQAMAVTRDALASYPNSDYAPQLRGRLGSIKRMITPSAEGTPAQPPRPDSTPAAAVPQR